MHHLHVILEIQLNSLPRFVKILETLIGILNMDTFTAIGNLNGSFQNK